MILFSTLYTIFTTMNPAKIKPRELTTKQFDAAVSMKVAGFDLLTLLVGEVSSEKLAPFILEQTTIASFVNPIADPVKVVPLTVRNWRIRVGWVSGWDRLHMPTSWHVLTDGEAHMREIWESIWENPVLAVLVNADPTRDPYAPPDDPEFFFQ